MINKIKISDVIIEKELYPRTELDQENVNQYRDAIDKLPPIVVSKDMILIDGYHRLTAHRLEKIEEINAEILDITDKKEILLEAIRRNTTHGKQLSKIEKKYWAEQLYKRNVGKPQIAKELSVSDKSVGRWLSSLDQEKDEKVNEMIKRLYLRCYSYPEIVDELSRQGVELKADTKEGKESFTAKRIQECKERHMSNLTPPDDLQLYNVWKVFQMPETQMKYPGQIPTQAFMCKRYLHMVRVCRLISCEHFNNCNRIDKQ